MSLGEQQSVQPSAPPLRVFNPDELDRPDVVEEAGTAKETDVPPSPDGVDPEVEAFWAGRNSASRISARIAA
jgi:hypothetical protein